MPARSKFTRKRTALIVAAVSVGASRRTAASLVGIDHATLHRWLERGRNGHPDGRWRRFYGDVIEAETHPRLRSWPVLDEPSDVRGAWKIAEQDSREELRGPVSVSISFSDGSPIRGES